MVVDTLIFYGVADRGVDCTFSIKIIVLFLLYNVASDLGIGYRNHRIYCSRSI